MWPFPRTKKQAGAKLGDDVFWLRDAPRVEGVVAAASRALTARSHVLLVTHVPARVQSLAEAVARAGLPLDGLAEPITAPEFMTRVGGQPAPCVALALAGWLRPPSTQDAAPARRASLIVLVADRHPLRANDDAIMAFAESLRATRVEFHLCTEDPLMKAFRGKQTEGMLRALGMTDDQSISHYILNRSVARAQRKVARRCPDHANVESWLAQN